LMISSISIWEIGIKTRKGKLRIPLSLEGFSSRLQRIDGFLILPVDEEIWIRSLNLEWEPGDPADRAIVASSMLLWTKLLTTDSTILDYYADARW